MSTPRLKEKLLLWVQDLIERESKDWVSVFTRARLHKLSRGEARILAPKIIKAAEDAKLPLPYFLAVIRQESAFDPRAINPNGYPGNVEKTDYGIGQISGRNLIAMFPKLSDEERIAKAFDPDWALQQMARTYAELRNWAQQRYPTMNWMVVATMAYNRGRNGASRILDGVAEPSQAFRGKKHAGSVMRFYERYNKEAMELVGEQIFAPDTAQQDQRSEFGGL